MCVYALVCVRMHMHACVRIAFMVNDDKNLSSSSVATTVSLSVRDILTSSERIFFYVPYMLDLVMHGFFFHFLQFFMEYVELKLEFHF